MSQEKLDEAFPKQGCFTDQKQNSLLFVRSNHHINLWGKVSVSQHVFRMAWEKGALQVSEVHHRHPGRPEILCFHHDVECSHQYLESFFVLQAELREISTAKLRGQSGGHPVSLVSSHGVVGLTHEGVAL